jgi:hypothetical protein
MPNFHAIPRKLRSHSYFPKLNDPVFLSAIGSILSVFRRQPLQLGLTINRKLCDWHVRQYVVPNPDTPELNIEY